MALQKASLRCMNYQAWMLRSFVAGVNGSATARPLPPFLQHRTFTTALPRHDQSRTATFRDDHNAADELNNALSPESTKTSDIDVEASSQSTQPTGETQQYIPWYLQPQHQPSTPFDSPLAARQVLPELPLNPPSILQPLLEHTSVDLGMDDLTLLDLRALDPPPALGANLLMIIGTARSERHLHVSADRLCRWLRSTYNLHPYADGLLGRNELKLKMRRRLKRSRLLSAVGAKATGEGDLEEGLRTGWVCVNVGRVEGGELPADERKLQRREGIVGFGARSEGCNIVVQMLTADKREEIDLEKLWEGIIGRAAQDSKVGVQQSSIAADGGEIVEGRAVGQDSIADNGSAERQELRQ